MTASTSLGWLERLDLIADGQRWPHERLCYNRVVTASEAQLDGRLTDASVQQVQVNHVVGGRVVFLDVVPVTRGSFRAPVRLHQGMNELVVAPFDASGRSYSQRVVVKGTVREWVETLTCAVVFALIIKTFVLQPFFIPSQSMEDTLRTGDRIMVSRLDYLFGAPARGDVIVFEYPREAGRYFVKRVVAGPRQRVEIVDGVVYVDGAPQREPWLKRQARQDGVSLLDNYRDLPPVPPDNYFVMGDNRDQSADSRSWGTVPASKVVGRASFVWYPADRWGVIR